jgi:hypothetical protein
MYIYAYLLNTLYCWQRCTNHPRCQQAFQVQHFYLKKKIYSWYIKIVKTHLMVRQWKSFRVPGLKYIPYVFGMTEVNHKTNSTSRHNSNEDLNCET